MFGLSISELSTLLSLVVLTITQVILVISGKFSDVTRIEQKKQHAINKLYKKAEKTKAKLSSQVSKIDSLESSKKNNNEEVK